MSIRNKVSESFSGAINAVQDKISKLSQHTTGTKRLRNNVLLQVFYDDQNY